MVNWGGERNDVFYIGSDHTLHQLWSGTSRTADFGNVSWGGFWAANQGVAATTWGPGRLDVFAITPDHLIDHVWQDSSATGITWNEKPTDNMWFNEGDFVTALTYDSRSFNVYFDESPAISGDAGPGIYLATPNGII